MEDGESVVEIIQPRWIPLYERALPEAVRAEGMPAWELDRIVPLAQANAALVHASVHWFLVRGQRRLRLWHVGFLSPTSNSSIQVPRPSPVTMASVLARLCNCGCNGPRRLWLRLYLDRLVSRLARATSLPSLPSLLLPPSPLRSPRPLPY